MLVLGDAHAADLENRRQLEAAYDAVIAPKDDDDTPPGHPQAAEGFAASDVTTTLQLGDLEYYDLPRPTWFIAGNNEDFDVVDAYRTGERQPGDGNATLLASSVVEREGLRIAGLSGNFAPTQYHKSRSELEGDRRRHFVREDVERARSLTDVDVFLAHEAPNGLPVEEPYDVGCEYVNAIIDVLEPSLCLVGHHHQHAEGECGDTHVVGIAPAWEAFYTLDPDTLAIERHDTPETPRD